MVCSECFNDLELKKFIESNSSETGDCDSCGCSEAKLLEIAELLDFFSEFLEIFIDDETISFAEGELIERGVSYKYTISSFKQLVEQASWQVVQVWTDSKQWFSVQLLIAS